MGMNEVMMLVDCEVENDVFKLIDGEECEELESIDLDYDSEKSVEELNLNDVKCGLLVRSEGYRGYVCYEGFVLIDDEYWLCDFVNEGLMWKVIDVDMVKKYM